MSSQPDLTTATQHSARSTQHSTLAELEAWMAGRHLGGHWRVDPALLYTPTPQTSVQPHLWPWADVAAALAAAGALVSLAAAERRTVRLLNPGVGRFTTHTMQLSVQLVKPGEVARAHRHTPAAYRFVLHGAGAYTAVEGQQCRMEPGDLILTPQWTWHHHANDGDAPMIWLDGLDHPLITLLHLNVFEPYGAAEQPIASTSDAQPAPWTGAPRAPVAAPLYHYRWRDAYPALRALAAEEERRSPFDGAVLEYHNPHSGGPTLPALALALQQLAPGERTAAHRHRSTTIYHVVRGRGASRVGDVELIWEQGDTFVVPIWYAHAHANASAGEEAILFRVTDAPVVQALGLYLEEPC